MGYYTETTINVDNYITLLVHTKDNRTIHMDFEGLNPSNDNELNDCIRITLDYYGLSLKDFDSCDAVSTFPNEEAYVRATVGDELPSGRMGFGGDWM